MVVSARPRDLGIPGTRWSLARLRGYLVQTGTVPALSQESLRITLKRAGLSLTSTRRGQIQKGVTTMIPGAFEYHAPSSLGEATALLAKLGDDAKVLSGGQSLIPLMKLRLAAPHRGTRVAEPDQLRALGRGRLPHETAGDVWRHPSPLPRGAGSIMTRDFLVIAKIPDGQGRYESLAAMSRSSARRVRGA